MPVPDSYTTGRYRNSREETYSYSTSRTSRPSYLTGTSNYTSKFSSSSLPPRPPLYEARKLAEIGNSSTTPHRYYGTRTGNYGSTFTSSRSSLSPVRVSVTPLRRSYASSDAASISDRIKSLELESEKEAGLSRYSRFRDSTLSSSLKSSYIPSYPRDRSGSRELPSSPLIGTAVSLLGREKDKNSSENNVSNNAIRSRSSSTGSGVTGSRNSRPSRLGNEVKKGNGAAARATDSPSKDEEVKDPQSETAGSSNRDIENNDNDISEGGCSSSGSSSLSPTSSRSSSKPSPAATTNFEESVSSPANNDHPAPLKTLVNLNGNSSELNKERSVPSVSSREEKKSTSALSKVKGSALHKDSNGNSICLESPLPSQTAGNKAEKKVRGGDAGREQVKEGQDLGGNNPQDKNANLVPDTTTLVTLKQPPSTTEGTTKEKIPPAKSKSKNDLLAHSPSPPKIIYHKIAVVEKEAPEDVSTSFTIKAKGNKAIGKKEPSPEPMKETTLETANLPEKKEEIVVKLKIEDGSLNVNGKSRGSSEEESGKKVDRLAAGKREGSGSKSPSERNEKSSSPSPSRSPEAPSVTLPLPSRPVNGEREDVTNGTEMGGPHSSKFANSSKAKSKERTTGPRTTYGNTSDSDNESDGYSTPTTGGRFRTKDGIHSDKSGLTGLRNIGNTCFMNSVVQCLSNTRPLLKYVLRDEYTSDLNASSSSMKGLLIRAYGELIQELWRETRTVDTSAFKDQIQRFAPRFMGYSQQDAQEFLRYLLEGLHEDVNRVKTKPKAITTDIDDSFSDQQKSVEAWKRYLRFDDSKIVDLFVGQLKSTLKCTTCGHCSVTFDPFWDLSLPIPSRSGLTRLSQCLELFTKEEVLDGDEKPTCSKCQVRRKCTKSFSIQKFPKILVIHLKRFSPTERYRGKLSTTVDFPLTDLDMTPYAASRGPDSYYNLYAVSNHSGSTYSGHYIAYCKHPYSGEWHCYNDSRVSPISSQNVVSSEGYVLFYELAGQSSHL